MKKKRVIAFILSCTVLCSFASCKADTKQNNDTTASITVSQSVDETVKSTAQENSESTEPVIDFEITDWTMKDFVTDMEICGYKFTMPCSATDISKKSDVKFVSYNESSDLTSGSLYLDKKYVASIYCNGKESDISDKTIIDFVIADCGDDMPMPEQFNFMGITQDSTQDDITNILGKPNTTCESDREFTYIFDNDNRVKITFSNENPSKIYFMYVSYDAKN